MRDSGKARLNYPVVAVVILLIGGAIYAGVNVYQSRGDDSAFAQQPGPTTADAAQHLRVTLDPNLFVGDVKKAYEIADRDPALLAQLYCYCGCDRTDGHKNLLDCYRDNHGSHCAICTGEAIEAEKLASQGMPVEKIRDALRDRFAHGE